MTTDDGFTRTLEQIDHDLHEACEKRTKGTDEILHGVFMVERAELGIARLIEERLRVTGKSDSHAVV